MKTSLKLLAPLVATLTIALTPRDAHALGPVGIEVGGIVGFGTNPTPLSTNPLGFGAGGRAGISIFNIYGGLDIIDYLGGGDGFGGTFHALQYGGELGYSIKLLDIFTIRPQLGLGNIQFSDSATGGGISLSINQSSFYLEPGVTALITLGIIYFGVDANALIITSGPSSTIGSTSTDTAFTLHGQIGLSF
jgi:hypothetical protein